MLHYYMLDLETTGLSASKHEVTQISIIRCADRHQLSKYIKAEHPETASYEALKITGRTYKDIQTGESKEEVVEFVNDFLNQDGLTPEHRCIVGHNVHKFDLRFTHALWEKVGKEFPAHIWLDTIPFSKAYAAKNGIDMNSFALDACLNMMEIKKFGMAHNAKTDTRSNYKLWLKLMDSGLNYLDYIKRVPHVIETENDS